MAKSRPDKKRERNAGGQLPLPPPQPAAASAATRVLPMQLKVGDRLADATGEWEVSGHPYMTNGGKTAHIRVKRVDQPAVTEIRTWGAHERISVKRVTAEEGKR